MGFVLVLIYLLSRLEKHWQLRSGIAGAGRAESAIQILEKHYIDNRRGLAVAELGGVIYYLGLGDDVTCLGKVEDAAEIERIRGLTPGSGGFGGFPKQLERVTDYLRRNQLEKSREALRGETDAIRGKSRGLRAKRGENKE
jgi:hypothetical protein